MFCVYLSYIFSFGAFYNFKLYALTKPITAASRSANKSTSGENPYPRGERPPPYAVAQGYLHTGNGTLPQIRIRDPNLRIKVSNCYIERNAISLGQMVKEGNFGIVYKAKWTLADGNHKIVAAKTLKHIDTETELTNFLKEGVMMKVLLTNISLYYCQLNIRYIFQNTLD